MKPLYPYEQNNNNNKILLSPLPTAQSTENIMNHERRINNGNTKMKGLCCFTLFPFWMSNLVAKGESQQDVAKNL
jgi:hypothetical protein